MGEISGVPGRLYKEYRVKRQETENMLIDLAEGLATQCVDEVKGRIVPEIEKLNNDNQRLVNLNYELIERVRLEEEKRRVLLEQKEEVDRRQEQSVEKYSEVENSLSKALETVGELEKGFKAQGEKLERQEVELLACKSGEDALWQTAVEVAKRLTDLGVMWGGKMRKTDDLQKNFGNHGVFSQISDSLSQLEALGNIVKKSEEGSNRAWGTVQELEGKLSDQQGELTTAKANHTNALKSVEDERDIVQRKLEVVEVEKEKLKKEVEETASQEEKRKAEKTILEEEERNKGTLDLENKPACCASLRTTLAQHKVEIAGLNRRLSKEGNQQKPSNVRRAVRRQVQQHEKWNRRTGEDSFGRFGGVKRRGDSSEGSPSESFKRKTSPGEYRPYSERHRDYSSERLHKSSDRSGGEGRGKYSSRRG